MLHRIASKFYTDVWAIRPDVHRAMGTVLQPHLRSAPREKSFSKEQYSRAISDDRADTRTAGGIAVLPVVGAIGKRLSLMEMDCAEGFDLLHLDSQILQLAARPDIHTVILDLNSPGGIATGVMESAALIQDLGSGPNAKRTIAFANLEACSAAYWLAAACNEIYAPPTANVGSIGTYIALLDETRAMEMEGLKLELFRDGALKGIGLPGLELDAAARDFLQARVDETGARFKNYVSARRPAAPAAAMQGQWFTAVRATEFGLVDGLHLSLDHLLAALLN